MKNLINELVNKIGTDKVLHFVIAALIVSWFGYINECMFIFSVIIVTMLSFIKERMDDVFNIKDFCWSIGGVIASALVYVFNNI